MQNSHFSDEWSQWIRTNVERGCSKDELFRILVDEGFDARAVERVLGHRPAIELSRIVNPLRAQRDAAGQRADAAAGMPRAPSATVVRSLKRFESERIELYTAERFLDAQECRAIVAAMRGRLRRSTITAPDEPDPSFRTSSTCDLGRLQEAVVRKVDARICAALGTSEAYAEPTQAQHYDVGGEFKPHTDTFEAHELERYVTPALGQRCWTFMVYLNDTEAGGETAFVNAGLVVRPRRGRAVIWNNLLPDGRPNPDTLHHGMPVKRGHKDIITKWFRLPRA